MNIFQYEGEGSNGVLRQIKDWVAVPELADLVHAFHGNYDRNAPLAELIGQLLDISEAWDFRGRQKRNAENRENARWTIEGGQLSKEQVALSLRAARRLGLIGCTVPSKKRYDYILVLGGARMSCLFRMKYAKDVCEHNGVSAKSIVGLAGMREVMASERAAADTYAPNAKTEFDLMESALKKAFGASKSDKEQGETFENSNKSWALRSYDCGIPTVLLAAPSKEPEKGGPIRRIRLRSFGRSWMSKTAEACS